MMIDVNVLGLIQTIVLALIGAVVSVIVAKQNGIKAAQAELAKDQATLKKQSEEIHTAVNSKSDAYIREIAELKEQVRGLQDLPGVVSELKELHRVLVAQNVQAATDKVDAARDRRLAGIEAAVSRPAGPTALPLVSLAPLAPVAPALGVAGVAPGTVPVTIVKQTEPLPVKVVDEPPIRVDRAAHSDDDPPTP